MTPEEQAERASEALLQMRIASGRDEFGNPLPPAVWMQYRDMYEKLKNERIQREHAAERLKFEKERLILEKEKQTHEMEAEKRRLELESEDRQIKKAALAVEAFKALAQAGLSEDKLLSVFEGFTRTTLPALTGSTPNETLVLVDQNVEPKNK